MIKRGISEKEESRMVKIFVLSGWKDRIAFEIGEKSVEQIGNQIRSSALEI